MINGKNNIYVVCLFSWIAVDDDNDDIDDLTSISRIMKKLYYLSWSVDFSTYNDDDDDLDGDDDNDDDVSTIYATWLLHHHYLSIHLSPTLNIGCILCVGDMGALSVVYHDSAG